MIFSFNGGCPNLSCGYRIFPGVFWSMLHQKNHLNCSKIAYLSFFHSAVFLAESVSCQAPRFCQSADSPLTKVEDNRDWCVGNNREAVTISMPRCPHSLAKTMWTDCD